MKNDKKEYIKEKRYPKCDEMEKVKNGFNKGKQGYKCKNCGCNYTGMKNGYPDKIKQKTIGFRGGSAIK